MPKYSVEMTRTGSTTLSTGSINADATSPRRSKIFQVIFGVNGSPAADNVWLLQLQRCTTTGTATAVTPISLDPADAASITDAFRNHTVDPSLTANAILLSAPLNQRATFLWQAVPGGELVIPATANNGIAVRTPTGAAVAVTANVDFEE